jgi:transcriptional regulator with XRE-family HTH domain
MIFEGRDYMVGKRIKKLREEKGISQTDLAIRIGESKQTVYKYETGKITNIPSDKIEAIAIELGCSPAYLMGWIDTYNIPIPEDTPEAKAIRAFFENFPNETTDDEEKAKAVMTIINDFLKFDPDSQSSLVKTLTEILNRS